MGEGGVGILTGHARVLLAGLGGSLVEGKPGSSGRVNNTLFMLQLRRHNKKELN
jgi:hypothetical protein